ncbi:MAG TPA: DUF262 domain-containing HNH endonuclease family protein [Spirochaetota bacterium]|nr:DUF262 domain-containing HNH endonuclease family protein [Spirochaetota bacterium]HOM38921.1 DUF262 domain-containing HNH endonuclease family protein [Spirochaetota bacterium]
MEAKERPLGFLLLEGKIIIPFFQRTYVWNKDNWDELLSEFQDITKRNNFLGAIILKQLPAVSGEPKKLEVIDGQQRLTTLSILLKALYDSLSDEDKSTVKNNVWPILFYKKDAFGREEIRIEHSNVDSEAYKKIMNSEISKLDSINGNFHRILQCYKFFREKIHEMEKNRKKELLNRILDNENKMLVIIDLDENDDEQSIFDTLNTAGIRLTAAEIIKNVLYKKYIELSNKEKAIDYYNRTWADTFLKNEETVKYWETERQTGRLKRDNIEILLHSFGVIKGFYDPDKHTLTDLSKLYKEEVRKINDINDLESFINEIIEYAKIYREKILTFSSDVSFSFEDSTTRLLHILEVLEISTFHPFILYMFKKYQQDENQLQQVFHNLEKYMIRNMLSKNTEIKNYNKLCKQFIDDERNLERILQDNKFEGNVERGLEKISNKEASLLLFWVELYRRYKGNYDLKELKYDYSLEHIMPQKWEEFWSLVEVPHPKKVQLSEEEQKKDRNDKVYWIGNMTLLRSKLNSSLRNYDFERKMNGEKRKKGIKDYADLSITKDDIVTPYNNGDRTWNEEKIEQRTENLKREIKEIWGN